MSRQRLARSLVAVLLAAQLIGSLVATLERGWQGLGLSLIAAPVAVAVAVSWAIPPALALVALAFAGYGLFLLVRWIAKGPRTGVAAPRHEEVLEHISELERDLSIGERCSAMTEAKLNPVKLWLDDLRVPPDESWIWVKTPAEAIELLERGEVERLSLDHDLGLLDDDGNDIATGYTVLLFIEEQVVHGTTTFDVPTIMVHSANSAAHARMISARNSIYRRIGRPEPR